MTTKLGTAALAAAFLLPLSAYAAKGDREAGRAKAADACHGDAGKSETEGVPHLAGDIHLFLQWQSVYFRSG